MAPGSSLELARWAIFAFLIAYLAYHARLLAVLTDWISFAVDEGYTSYAARRIREGELPHRDFFFLWTPGTAYFHAAMQALGASWVHERAAAMVASAASCALALRWAKEWLGRGDLLLLLLLLFAWGFALWNIPYASWYAVLCALAAMRALPKRAVLSGALFALAFWFKQNVGILAFLGACAWLLLEARGDAEKRKVAFRFAGAFGAVFAAPFFLMLVFGGAEALLQALRQIFLFPLMYPSLMGTAPPARIFATPLTSLGLWLLSLFFLRKQTGNRTASLLQFGLLVYVGMQAWKAPREFEVGCFLLLSVLAWPLSLVAELAREDRPGFRRFLAFWLPGFGVFLQVLPRLDFQHFLFVAPFSLLLLARALKLLAERYPFLAGGWVRLPLLLLLAGGVFLQLQVQRTLRVGQPDPLGVITYELPYRLDEEAYAAIRFLRAEGLKAGDPLLVLPNATSFYQWSGFRNPTPHQQFFPGYVEAYGAKQEQVLAQYRERGGRYLLVQERSGLEENVPEIHRQIERDYEVLKMFPEYFTIYVPKARPR